MEGLKLSRYIHRRCRVEATVHFDHDLRLRANCTAYRLDQSDGAYLFSAFQFIEASPERVKLERAVSFCDDPPGGIVEFLRSPLHRVPAVGIRLDVLSYRSSEQLVDRLPQGLTNDIPTSYF